MSGRIPQAFLDQLLSRVDLVEVVDARVQLRKAGREYAACCPFHNEKTPSFYVSPGKQFYHCFGCGAHGNAIGFLIEYEHLGFVEAVEELARIAGLEVPREARGGGEHGRHDDLLVWVEAADRWFRQQLRSHAERSRAVDYLRGRGLVGETALAFGIGYAPPERDGLLKTLRAQGAGVKALVAAGLVVERDDGGHHDRFRERVMFPIRDRRGRTIAFGGRVLGDGQPKYLNSPETPLFHKGRELYGLHEARMALRQIPRLLVVEGYMDVVMLAQHGIRYAVATLGTATTAEHAERLFRLTRDVVFCFDGDRAGREAAWRALENVLPQLKDDRQIGFLFLPEGEDPDSLVRREGAEAFGHRLDGAVLLFDYLFERLKADINMNSLDGRSRLAGRARPYVERLPPGQLRDMMLRYVDKLAEQRGSALQALPRVAGAIEGIAPSVVARHNSRLVRTPVRHAIALLLNRPQLAREAAEPAQLAALGTQSGVPLLAELIELFRTQPHVGVAAALERYRGSETGRVLDRLATWQPELPEDLLESEFRGVLATLAQRPDPRKALMDKLAQGEALSAEEHEMLLRLTRTRGHSA